MEEVMAVIAIDPNELERRITEAELEALNADGYTMLVDGEKQYDREALAKDILKHVLSTELEREEEIGAKAVTKGTLMKLLFPSLTEPDPNELDDVEFAVATNARKRVVAKVSHLLQTGRRGLVQKKVAAQKRGLVMMTSPVGDDETPAWFVTADLGLLSQHWATPRTDRVNSSAAETAREFNFVIAHKPDAKKLLNTKMDAGIKQASATAKAVLQLTAGDSNGASDS
jgi:hypothetical protein